MVIRTASVPIRQLRSSRILYLSAYKNGFFSFFFRFLGKMFLIFYTYMHKFFSRKVAFYTCQHTKTDFFSFFFIFWVKCFSFFIHNR